MDNSFLFAYIWVCVFLALVDFYFARMGFKKAAETKEPAGRFLGRSAFFAGVVTLSYILSIQAIGYRCMSAASSLYFICIDWMLISLLQFVYLITDSVKFRNVFLRNVILGYACFDTVCLIVNVFFEVELSYTDRGTALASYSYQMKPLYYMHLGFSYLLIILVLFLLVHKLIKTPIQYHNQYILIVFVIVSVVIINAFFLYLDGSRLFNRVDISIIGYSFALYLMYWAAFDYRQNEMMKTLSMMIFQNIDQGIVLFDYAGALIMYNEKAGLLFSDIEFPVRMPCGLFLEKCSIPPDQIEKDQNTFLCDRRGSLGEPLRCDYRRLLNKKNKPLGNLFVFTDISNDTDLLTGFHRWEDFLQAVSSSTICFPTPASAAVFDIVGLGAINREQGHDAGDERIRSLVKILREILPKNTWFIRGYEANLIAVCMRTSEKELFLKAEEVISVCPDTVLYGLAQTKEDPGDKNSPEESDIRLVMDAVQEAFRSLRTKKLLDRNSIHSQTLTSLVTALQTSDSETEAHVQRTEKLGSLLGERIGLPDADITDLRLLCLLHDIGKISIPLEILNKPGRLNAEEWAMLRTHPENGYQIAMSNDELKPIARMILCHHERWDGKGYPNGLSGEEIPLLSRIISIVDAYDAMVNDRAYRKALSPETAQGEILRCSGTQFDPVLADEFLKMLAEDPRLAKGEHTGTEEIHTEIHRLIESSEMGNIMPVLYSRYLLDANEIIIETDDQFEDLTGFSRAEAEGKMSQFDLIPPEDRAHYMSQLGRQLSQANFAYLEHNILRKDGSRVPVLCYGKKFYDSAVRVFRSEILVTPKSIAALDKEV